MEREGEVGRYKSSRSQMTQRGHWFITDASAKIHGLSRMHLRRLMAYHDSLSLDCWHSVITECESEMSVSLVDEMHEFVRHVSSM